MAELGFRSVNEMIGRSIALAQRKDIVTGRRVESTFRLFCTSSDAQPRGARCLQAQDHGLSEALDCKLIELAKRSDRTPRFRFPQHAHPQHSPHRGHHAQWGIAKRYGSAGLPEDTISIQFTAARARVSARSGEGNHADARRRRKRLRRQGSFRAGKLVIYHPRKSDSVPEENILVGNVCLYAPTSGEAFFWRHAGERFAVRNSGAIAVVEGVGDHGCEYMTNGLVVVLGKNRFETFAAGMTGGIAYVWIMRAISYVRCNRSQWTRAPHDQKDADLLYQLISRTVSTPQARRRNGSLKTGRPRSEIHQRFFPHEFKRSAWHFAGSRWCALNAIRSDRARAGDRWVRSPASRNTNGSCRTRRPVEDRVKDYFEVYQPFPEEKVRTQGRSVHGLRHSFCHTGCPVNNIIPDWTISSIATVGKKQFAFCTPPTISGIHRAHLSRPCEAACVLGINEPPVAIKVIEKTIVRSRFWQTRLDQAGAAGNAHRTQSCRGWFGTGRTRRRQQLNRSGHWVTSSKRRTASRSSAIRHSGFQNGESGPRSQARTDGGGRRSL